MENTTQSIHAEKKFGKSVNELYDAWINADKLKQWWHPANNKLVKVENEVKEGGNIRYEFAGDSDETTIVITGNYKEVKPSEKLVYSWNWQVPGSQNLSDNHFELTVEFMNDGDGSAIRISQTNKDEIESIHPHEKGWDDELESLHQFLG